MKAEIKVDGTNESALPEIGKSIATEDGLGIIQSVEKDGVTIDFDDGNQGFYIFSECWYEPFKDPLKVVAIRRGLEKAVKQSLLNGNMVEVVGKEEIEEYVSVMKSIEPEAHWVRMQAKDGRRLRFMCFGPENRWRIRLQINP